MPYIQIFDEKKECWVLKKVKEVPKVEVAETPLPNIYTMNIPYRYTFDAELERRLREYQDRVQRIRAPQFVADNTIHHEQSIAGLWIGARAPEVTRAPEPPATYFPGSGEPPDRDEPRENQHVRRARLFQEARERARRAGRTC